MGLLESVLNERRINISHNGGVLKLVVKAQGFLSSCILCMQVKKKKFSVQQRPSSPKTYPISIQRSAQEPLSPHWPR